VVSRSPLSKKLELDFTGDQKQPGTFGTHAPYHLLVEHQGGRRRSFLLSGPMQKSCCGYQEDIYLCKPAGWRSRGFSKKSKNPMDNFPFHDNLEVINFSSALGSFHSTERCRSKETKNSAAAKRHTQVPFQAPQLP